MAVMTAVVVIPKSLLSLYKINSWPSCGSYITRGTRAGILTISTDSSVGDQQLLKKQELEEQLRTPSSLTDPLKETNIKGGRTQARLTIEKFIPSA